MRGMKTSRTGWPKGTDCGQTPKGRPQTGLQRHGHGCSFGQPFLTGCPMSRTFAYARVSTAG